MIKFPVYILMLCTAYTASVEECGKADGITASGEPARANYTVACDSLPMGTKIRFLDGSVRVVHDRFGGDYSNRLDIYMDSQDDAWEFGRKYLFVEVIRDEIPQIRDWRAFWYDGDKTCFFDKQSR